MSFRSRFDRFDRLDIPRAVQCDGSTYVRVNDPDLPGDPNLHTPTSLRFTPWRVFWLVSALVLLSLLVVATSLFSAMLVDSSIRVDTDEVQDVLDDAQTRLEGGFAVTELGVTLATIEAFLTVVHTDIPVAFSEVHATSLIVNSTAC